MEHRRRLGGRFWSLWSSVGVSAIGDGMLTVAYPLLALRYTRSPVALSAVLVAQLVPSLLVAVPIGTAADRFNKQRLAVRIQVARLLVSGSFFMALVFHSISLPFIYISAFAFGGLAMAFEVICGSSLSSVVKPDRVLQANARLMNAEMSAENLIGHGLGGAALSLSSSIPFLTDTVGTAASIALVRRAIKPDAPVRTSDSFLGEASKGIRWYLGQPSLRLLTIILASLAFCQSLVLALLALYTRVNLGLSDTGYGLLLAVSSIGLPLGSLLAPRVHARLGPTRTIFAAGAAAAMVYPVMALTTDPLVAAPALMIEASAVVIGNVAGRSMRQELVPPTMQGRAASAYSLLIRGSQPFGAICGGILGSVIGLDHTFMAAAALQLVFVAVAGPRFTAEARRRRKMTADGWEPSPADETGAGSSPMSDESVGTPGE